MGKLNVVRTSSGDTYVVEGLLQAIICHVYFQVSVLSPVSKKFSFLLNQEQN